MSALALSAAIASIQVAAPPPSSGCKADPPTPARSQSSPGPRKLGELPDGRLMRLVLRTVDGCDMMEVLEVRQEAAGSAWTLEPTGSRMRPSPAGPLP